MPENGEQQKPASASAEPSNLETKIIKQIEYYFGDINLPRDKFLQEELKKDDGWVQLSTLLTFNRLKSLTTDPQVICDALKKSEEELVEVDETGKKLRRSLAYPLPDNSVEYWTKIKARTLYCKGFPQTATLDEIQKFFKNDGTVKNVVMRKFIDPESKEKKFKGSIFLTMSSEDEAKKILETRKDAKFSPDDKEPMRILTQTAYYIEKSEERKAYREQAKTKKEEAKAKAMEEAQNEILAEVKNGLILRLSDLPAENAKGTPLTREDIKGCLAFFGNPAWVEFVKGETVATVRFDGEENAAKLAVDGVKEKNDGKVVVFGKEVQTTVLEGDEEKEYWRNVVKMQQEFKASKRGRGRGRGRGGRGFGRFGGSRHDAGEAMDTQESSLRGSSSRGRGRGGRGRGAAREPAQPTRSSPRFKRITYDDDGNAVKDGENAAENGIGELDASTTPKRAKSDEKETSKPGEAAAPPPPAAAPDATKSGNKSSPGVKPTEKQPTGVTPSEKKSPAKPTAAEKVNSSSEKPPPASAPEKSPAKPPAKPPAVASESPKVVAPASGGPPQDTAVGKRPAGDSTGGGDAPQPDVKKAKAVAASESPKVVAPASGGPQQDTAVGKRPAGDSTGGGDAPQPDVKKAKVATEES